jgi:GNAT superfamily N-acetyltransferase
MNIRDATRKDYAAIGKMMQAFEVYIEKLEPTAKKKKPIDRVKAMRRLDIFDHGGAGLIAWDAGKPIGYLIYFPSASFGTMERTLFMPDLYVAAKHRGKGVGAKLMKALMRKARERRATSIMWTVYDRNPKAMAFYYALGAHIIRDDLLMAMEVPKPLLHTRVRFPSPAPESRSEYGWLPVYR